MSNRVHLSSVTQINPRLPKGVDETQQVSFLSMAAVSEEGKILRQETRKLSETKKGYTYFERNDVLLAKITPCFENGKAALASDLEHPIGFGSTEFHVLRPDPIKLDAKYLFYLVWSRRFRYLGQKAMTGAAGQRRVPTDFLKNFEIPLPPLDDQKRIAHLLGKVEGLITRRKQHLQQLDDLLKSVFLEMFGDPVRNEKGWDKPDFETIISGMRNGLSPSKTGVYKGRVYTLSAITGDSFQEIFKADNFSQIHDKYFPTDRDFLVCRGNGNINLVGKGHFFPGVSEGVIFPDTIIAVSIRPRTVNKHFLEALWKTKFIRQQIENNARTTNGAHKINQGVIEKIKIIQPPTDLQNQYATIVEKVEGLKSRYQQSLIDLENLYGALSQKAFKGELDLSRVVLQVESTTEDTESTEEWDYGAGGSHGREAMPQGLNASDNIEFSALDEYPMSTREGRQRLLRRFFDAFLKGLKGDDVLSFETFWKEVYFNSTDYMTEDDENFGSADYDLLKTWVYEALEQGRLIQGYDDVNNRVQLKAAVK